MRLAPSRTRAPSWGTRGGEDSSVHPSIHATVSEWGGSGGQCYSPKAKRQTERCDSFPSFLRFCPPPLLPPAPFGFEGGGGIFWFGYSLCLWGFFWFWVYFWYPSVGLVPRVPVLVRPPSRGCGIADRFQTQSFPEGGLGGFLGRARGRQSRPEACGDPISSSCVFIVLNPSRSGPSALVSI